MEDRRTAGLYLAAGRVPAMRGARHASVWEDCVPGRADLPRTLPELPVLTIAEVDDELAAPEGGYHFVATARPGQGILTGRPTIGLCLVLISPRTAEGAQALRDWGDFVHIRHIAEAGVPGYTMITPYESATGGEPRYLHLYEIDRDDPEAVFQSMTPLVASRLGGRDSDAYREWAWHPELRIDYVSTYRRARHA